ncbi:hypothetical protein [Kutzneria kofuensis]|uniref:Uncharacterized protein n=1 Tax=Kutzneria kofuensis TaxID=103725 RepID=A0A7W9NK11_9PSEU|nr:hypothetical protein [Kutzneria kofuensis]MBB5894728.1 hypothetical protein [Kutzneria kofuensis]
MRPIGFAVEQAVQVDDLARRLLGVALCCHRSMMPIAIFVSGRIVTLSDDRRAVVAERPAPGSVEPIIRRPR